MRRREDHPIARHTVNFYYGDYAKLQGLYPEIGAAKAIRDIIRAHIRMVEENAAQRIPLRDDLEDELEIDRYD